MAGAEDALHRYGTGLTGSRLLNGTTPLHLELERELAEWMGTDDAIVFTTGHQANVGTLGTLLGPGDTVIVDSGDHASILDGVLLSARRCAPSATTAWTSSRAPRPRAKMAAASWSSSTASSRWRATSRPARDRRALPALRRASDGRRGARRRRARRARRGRLELLGVEDRVDLRMGTFSKSLASCGGFVAGPADVIEYLRISSRAFLFTASAVPAARRRGAGGAAVHPLAGGPTAAGNRARQRRYLRDGLRELGLRSSAERSREPVRHGPGEDASRRDGRHAGRARPRRRRLEGGAAVEGALRRRRLHEHGAPPGRAAGGRAAAHQRDGHARRARRSTARSRSSRGSSASSRPSTVRCPSGARADAATIRPYRFEHPLTCPFLHKSSAQEKGRF